MPNKQAPNSRRNLDIAIDRISRPQNDPVQTRILMAHTIIGQLMPDGAVKGGTALKFRYGDHTTRFTRDMDAARATELGSFIEKLGKNLQDGWNGFAGRIVAKEPAKPKGIPNEYIMRPFEIKLEYNRKSWVTVIFEIGHDEIGDTAEPEHFISPDIVALFETLGFPAPRPVALMPISHQIAQKLHALSAEGSVRVHDLIDLQLIANNEAIDFGQTKDVCARLFRSRKMQPWAPTIVKGEAWDNRYAEQKGDLDVLPTISAAVEWVNALILEIDHGG